MTRLCPVIVALVLVGCTEPIQPTEALTNFAEMYCSPFGGAVGVRSLNSNDHEFYCSEAVIYLRRK